MDWKIWFFRFLGVYLGAGVFFLIKKPETKGEVVFRLVFVTIFTLVMFLVIDYFRRSQL
jgi:hypothetical protein